MLKNALTRLFNYDLNQASPVQDDLVQVRKRDEDGNLFIVYEKYDYPKHQSSLGFVSDWSLNALLRAGVNPNFAVSTGNPTRLEGAGIVAQFAAQADSYLNDVQSENYNKDE